MVGASGEISIRGDTPTPPKVTTDKVNSTIPIPEGSTIVFNERLGEMAIKVSKPTQIALNRTETHVEGPVSFTPDKAPTIKEEKDAQSDYWVKLGLYACVLIGGSAAIFGLVRQWNMVMYGGIAVLGSGLFGLFVQRHPILLLVIGLGVALKVAGPAIWHLQVKHLKPKNDGSG